MKYSINRLITFSLLFFNGITLARYGSQSTDNAPSHEKAMKALDPELPESGGIN